MPDVKCEAKGSVCCQCHFWKVCQSLSIPDPKNPKAPQTVFMGVCSYYCPGRTYGHWPVTAETDLCNDFEPRAAAPQSSASLN